MFLSAMKGWRRRWLSGALALLALISPAAQAAATEIRIAVSDIGAGSQPSGGGLVDLIYGRRLLEREFAKDGVSVRWLFIKGAGPVINEAFANRQIDVAYLGDLASIIGRSRGLDTRVIAAAARGVNHYLAVAPGSDIKRLQDLAGKRVGLFRGTAAELSFVAALRSQGLSAKDIRIINLDFAAASAALAAGQIDATWGGSNVLALRDKGLAQIPVSTKDLNGAGQLAGLVLASGTFLHDNPGLLARLVKVQQQAAAWAGDPQNRDDYIRQLAQQSGYPEKIIREDLENMPPLSQLLSPQLDESFANTLNQSINAAYESRLIRKSFSVREWLDDSLLTQKR